MIPPMKSARLFFRVSRCVRALTSFAVAHIDNSYCPHAKREGITRLCAFLMDRAFQCKPFLGAVLVISVERND